MALPMPPTPQEEHSESESHISATSPQAPQGILRRTKRQQQQLKRRSFVSAEEVASKRKSLDISGVLCGDGESNVSQLSSFV